MPRTLPLPPSRHQSRLSPIPRGRPEVAWRVPPDALAPLEWGDRCRPKLCPPPSSSLTSLLQWRAVRSFCRQGCADMPRTLLVSFSQHQKMFSTILFVSWYFARCMWIPLYRSIQSFAWQSPSGNWVSLLLDSWQGLWIVRTALDCLRVVWWLHCGRMNLYSGLNQICLYFLRILLWLFLSSRLQFLPSKSFLYHGIVFIAMLLNFSWVDPVSIEKMFRIQSVFCCWLSKILQIFCF